MPFPLSNKSLYWTTIALVHSTEKISFFDKCLVWRPMTRNWISNNIVFSSGCHIWPNFCHMTISQVTRLRCGVPERQTDVQPSKLVSVGLKESTCWVFTSSQGYADAIRWCFIYPKPVWLLPACLMKIMFIYSYNWTWSNGMAGVYGVYQRGCFLQIEKRLNYFWAVLSLNEVSLDAKHIILAVSVVWFANWNLWSKAWLKISSFNVTLLQKLYLL